MFICTRMDGIAVRRTAETAQSSRQFMVDIKTAQTENVRAILPKR